MKYRNVLPYPQLACIEGTVYQYGEKLWKCLQTTSAITAPLNVEPGTDPAFWEAHALDCARCSYVVGMTDGVETPKRMCILKELYDVATPTAEFPAACEMYNPNLSPDDETGNPTPVLTGALSDVLAAVDSVTEELSTVVSTLRSETNTTLTAYPKTAFVEGLISTALDQVAATYLTEDEVAQMVASGTTGQLTEDQVSQIVAAAVAAAGTNAVTTVQMNSAISAMLATVSTTYAAKAELDAHVRADASAWQDYYTSEARMIDDIAKGDGLKKSATVVQFPEGEEGVVPGDFGGVLALSVTNTSTTYVAVRVNNVLTFTSEGRYAGYTFEKAIRIPAGATVRFDGPGAGVYALYEVDETNPVRASLARMETDIAANKLALSTMNARLSNKSPSGIMTDIGTASQGSGFIVPENNSLGGRIHGKGVNAILGSTGVVTVTNSQGSVEVYNNLGLLSLLAPVPILVEDVMDGDTVTASGMAELFYEPYIAGV